MVRIGRLALVLAVGLALSAKEAQAQFYYPGYYGPGWCAPGPYWWHSYGAYEWSVWGSYEGAVAESINVDTFIRLNQYLYLSGLEADQRHRQRLVYRQQRATAHDQSTYKQLSENPTSADIERGAALNAILDQVTNPQISHSAFHRAKDPISRELIAGIWFSHTPSSSTFNLGRLTTQDGWPIALRGKPFAAARQAYQATVQQAITEALAGTLSSETVQAVRAAADRLYTQFQQTPPTDREEWSEAKAYLQTLLNISRGLNKPAVEKILTKVLPTPQVTVGDLLSFMHISHLRFGPALTPEQLAAYEELYTLIATARDQIFQETGVAATAPPPAAILSSARPGAKRGG